MTGRSHAAVGTVLSDLADQGLVMRRAAGKAVLHEPNRRHLLWPAVEAMAQAKQRLFAEILSFLDRWELKPLHMSAYGSVIAGRQGRGSVESDVDLVVVLPPDARSAEHDARWTEQLGELAKAIQEWTGNPAEIVDYTVDELRELGPESVDYLQDLLRGRQLYGDRLRTLLAEEEFE